MKAISGQFVRGNIGAEYPGAGTIAQYFRQEFMEIPVRASHV